LKTDIFDEMSKDFAIMRALESLTPTPDISARVIDPGYGVFSIEHAPRWQPQCDSCQFVGRYDPVHPLGVGYIDGALVQPDSFDLWVDPSTTPFVIAIVTWGPTTCPHKGSLRGGDANMIFSPRIEIEHTFPYFHPLQIALQGAIELNILKEENK
jgi:hypothetical protein